ncbi:hypothetical protein ABFX02_10G100500 [Erythranthe guttata]
MMSAGNVFSVPNSAASAAKVIFAHEFDPNPNPNPNSKPVSSNNASAAKKKRNLPGTPDPDAEVIALSPKTLMATNRFICEICNKGFQRDQNLQLHRRGHNLPWKLKQRAKTDLIKKKVYICPEKNCVHHDPARALGDLTGIKKHFSRKHGEKKWKCEKCSKKYAVQSDWKAHSKTCGTREYKCDCGTLFSRKDSFITHRAFCDALAEESARNIVTTVGSNNNSCFNFTSDVNSNLIGNPHEFSNINPTGMPHFSGAFRPEFAGNSFLGGDHHQNKPRSLSLWMDQQQANNNINSQMNDHSSNMFGSNNNGLPDHHMMHMSAANNVYGSSSSSMGNYGNLSLSPLLPPQHGLKEEQLLINNHGNKGNNATSSSMMADSLASLYSESHQLPPAAAAKSSPPAPMSATALLQKAAQMGSTKSNPNFFGNSVGVMMNNNSSSPSSSSTTNNLSFGGNAALAQNRSELHQVFGGGGQRPENPTADEMMNFSTAAVGNIGDGRHRHHQSMISQSAALNMHSALHGVENSLTRDFLGIGGGDGGAGAGGPFSPQELAKFASMSSAMGLSHFTSNH